MTSHFDHQDPLKNNPHGGAMNPPSWSLTAQLAALTKRVEVLETAVRTMDAASELVVRGLDSDSLKPVEAARMVLVAAGRPVTEASIQRIIREANYRRPLLRDAEARLPGNTMARIKAAFASDSPTEPPLSVTV